MHNNFSPWLSKWDMGGKCSHAIYLVCYLHAADLTAHTVLSTEYASSSSFCVCVQGNQSPPLQLLLTLFIIGRLRLDIISVLPISPLYLLSHIMFSVFLAVHLVPPSFMSVTVILEHSLSQSWHYIIRLPCSFVAGTGQAVLYTEALWWSLLFIEAQLRN